MRLSIKSRARAQAWGRLVVRLPLIGAAATFTAASMYFNARHAAAAGPAMMAVAVAADALKSAALPVRRQALAAGDKHLARAASLILVVTLAYALVAAYAAAVTSRDGLADGRQGQIDAHVRTEGSRKAATDELARLAPTRPAATVDAALAAGAGIDARVWRVTKGCTEVTRAQSQEACKPAGTLRQELATARRREALETAVREADAVLAKGRPGAADPLSERLSQLTGGLVSVAMVQALIGLLLVALLELGCTAGWVLALGTPAGVRRAEAVTKPQGTPLAAGDLPSAPEAPAVPAGAYGHAEAEADLVTELALGHVRGTRELARRWQRPESTVSRWLAEWEAHGLITRQKQGRRVVLALA